MTKLATGFHMVGFGARFVSVSLQGRVFPGGEESPAWPVCGEAGFCQGRGQQLLDRQVRFVDLWTDSPGQAPAAWASEESFSRPFARAELGRHEPPP